MHNSTKCFHVILDSADRPPGSSLGSARFRVRLPDSFKAAKLQLSVLSMFHATSPRNNAVLDQQPWSLHLVGMDCPHTYTGTVGPAASLWWPGRGPSSIPTPLRPP